MSDDIGHDFRESDWREITGYERLEGSLVTHEAGGSYCKKFCNKTTDDPIHDYEEDPEEFGF